MESGSTILAVNGGSSSIKFALFSVDDPPKRILHGQIERIGEPGTRLIVNGGSNSAENRSIDSRTYRDAATSLAAYLRERAGNAIGVGHRVVHGGIKLLDHQLVTDELVAELRRSEPLDLAHLPREIELIEAMRESFPSALQVACFDTAFGRDLPRVAAMLPIPRRYYEAGVRRFGFHGLSFTYLLDQLAVVAGREAANGRVVLAHLGSGASMAAVHGGKPIDTTMAFTPTAGLVMGTRPGDMDPGLMVYLMRAEKFGLDEVDEFISHKCGLIGISDTSSDMRDLLARRQQDSRAADAVDIFCYQARKFVAGLAAAMGGLDTLVFSGGIGEQSPEVRWGICQGLEFMGMRLNSDRNSASDPVVSADGSGVTVRVIRTDEELVIYRAVRRILRLGTA